MRKMIALLVSIAFSLSVAGIAAAQAPAAKPAEAPKAEQKTEKKAEMKKETKADCLKMAKDDAAKSECEKKYAKATKEMKKKEETAKKP
jgi:hypothetical protein